MNRNDLQAMLHYTNQIAKLMCGSKECRSCWCNDCDYYTICQTNTLLHDLIGHEADKYSVKGELINDNHQ